MKTVIRYKGHNADMYKMCFKATDPIRYYLIDITNAQYHEISLDEYLAF